MAYNDDAVLARLSSLNESHDSIATAAQWIMFHRRHADRTVQIWMQRLKDSSSTRRLSLVYLANEVAQQSRIRHKEDFIIAFSPVVAEAAATAYRGAPAEIQGKLKRVIDVWKDRNIFEAPIQAAIESRLDELDKARGTARPGFSGSPFAPSSIPSEFAPLVSTHQKITKLGLSLKGTVENADQEYEKQTDPSSAPPSAPVYAARLNGLLKTLANAEGAVEDSVKAREMLISGLEKLLQSNKTALESERSSASELSRRKGEIEDKKSKVELAIMRALGPADNDGSPAEGAQPNTDSEPQGPEMEALTPTSIEEEPADPWAESAQEETNATKEEETSESAPAYQTVVVTTNGSKKRRRVDDSGDFPDLGGEDDGIDADVAEMLKDGQESSV